MNKRKDLIEEYIKLISEEENLKKLQNTPFKNETFYFLFGNLLGSFEAFSIYFPSTNIEKSYWDDILESTLKSIEIIEKSNVFSLSRQAKIFREAIEEILSQIPIDGKLTERDGEKILMTVRLIQKELLEDLQNIINLYNFMYLSSIEESSKEDIIEAFNDYLNECYKSSIIMCRRVIQNELMKRGISSKRKNGNFKTIAEMIDEAKSRNIVDGKQHHNITSVRKLAGWSAHPQDDGLDDITKEDARKSLNATIQFLASLYSDENLKTLIID